MGIAVAEERPPYVTFELRAEEDRQQSIAQGHPVLIDVPYAIITPQGSKDRVERRAEDWFKQKAQQVEEGRFPGEWLAAFRSAFKIWQETNETPEMGTPLRAWPVITPAQLKTCLSANIRTVEDLAAATEEGISRLGMGAYALKAKAAAWLQEAKSLGANAERIAALELQNSSLHERNKFLEERIIALEAAQQPKKL